MFYILFQFSGIYYYKIIIFNIVVKLHEQLVDVSAIEVFYYYAAVKTFVCYMYIQLKYYDGARENLA